jgi:hypothetical protein
VDDIGAVVTSMPRESQDSEVTVLLVVDGKDDGTPAVVRGAGHFACVAPFNRGEGAALRPAIRLPAHAAQFIVRP